MLGEKVQHFQGKGTDLTALQGKIESYLQSEGFTVQTSAPSASRGRRSRRRRVGS